MTAILTGFPSLLDALRPQLEKQWGPLCDESALLPFPSPDNYMAKMGTDLYRKFYAFERLVQPEMLMGAKIWFDATEEKTNKERKDGVDISLQIDTTYLTLSKIVRATTHDLSHRIALAQGIYAEVLLQFGDTVYSALEWTPLDYRTRDYADFFLKARNTFKKQLATHEV